MMLHIDLFERVSFRGKLNQKTSLLKKKKKQILNNW